MSGGKPSDYEYELANFTVGLCKLNYDGKEPTATPVGTASLVQIGSLRGLLTAAHVLEILPDCGQISVVRFPRKGDQRQTQKIEMSLAEKVKLSGEKFGPEGPDLGFLKLPPVNVSNLQATNSFLNLEKSDDEILDINNSVSDHVDVVLGVVEEWTERHAGERPTERVVVLQMLAGYGDIIKTTEKNDFDFYTFLASYDDDFRKPDSYGGVSGGGLWRIFVQKNEDGDREVLSRSLIGLAFYEEHGDNGCHTIVCHGVKSIYRQLTAKLCKKWPELTGS